MLEAWEFHERHVKSSAFGVLVSVGDYEVSPTPPITVTHKPEEDTFGVSPVLRCRTLLHAFLVVDDSVFRLLCRFQIFARKISSFMTQDNNQKDFMACVRQENTDTNHLIPLVCSVEPGSSFKIRHPVKSLLAGSEILTLKK